MEKETYHKLNLKIAALCPNLFEVRETYRDGRLVKYLIRSGDEDSTEVDPTRDLNACHELIDLLQHYGWMCTMGNEHGWVCNFRRFRDGLGYKHAGSGNTLQLAICRAFVKTMEGK